MRQVVRWGDWNVPQRALCYSLTFAVLFGAAAIGSHYLRPDETLVANPSEEKICVIHNLEPVMIDPLRSAPECPVSVDLYAVTTRPPG